MRLMADIKLAMSEKATGSIDMSLSASKYSALEKQIF
jgi:hypothetical protein